MRIWKVYAENVRTNERIKEISEQEAKSIIDNAVDDMINNEDVIIDSYDDIEFQEKCEDLYAKAWGIFEKNNRFGCGDFRVVRQEDWPESFTCGYYEEV